MIADNWIMSAVVHTHSLAPWWPDRIAAPDRAAIRVVGNVAFLPDPVAGYRIRHADTHVVVEIKPSRAPAIELARCEDADAAGSILAQISVTDLRPFLGEFGRAA